jgi:hypothetical protein
VQFGAGIAPSEHVTTRYWRRSSAERLWYARTACPIPGTLSGYPVAEFRFTDGTLWSVDTIKTKVTTPTSGADTLIGFETNDSIAGLPARTRSTGEAVATRSTAGWAPMRCTGRTATTH